MAERFQIGLIEHTILSLIFFDVQWDFYLTAIIKSFGINFSHLSYFSVHFFALYCNQLLGFIVFALSWYLKGRTNTIKRLFTWIIRIINLLKLYDRNGDRENCSAKLLVVFSILWRCSSSTLLLWYNDFFRRSVSLGFFTLLYSHAHTHTHEKDSGKCRFVSFLHIYINIKYTQRTKENVDVENEEKWV